MSVDELVVLKKRIEECRAKSERAAGVIGRLLKELKEDWGVASLDEAEAKFLELSAKQTRAEKDYRLRLKDFQDKWGEKLEAVEKIEV